MKRKSAAETREPMKIRMDMTEYDLTNRRLRVIEPMNLRVRASVRLGGGRRVRQRGDVPEEGRECGECRDRSDDDEDDF